MNLTTNDNEIDNMKNLISFHHNIQGKVFWFHSLSKGTWYWIYDYVLVNSAMHFDNNVYPCHRISSKNNSLLIIIWLLPAKKPFELATCKISAFNYLMQRSKILYFPVNHLYSILGSASFFRQFIAI